LLIGYCTAPQPKGPFKITGAKPPTIDFKNPFLDAMEFTIRIDNPCFVSTTKSPIKIDAKKLISIQLTYKATPNFASNGRLTIQTGDLPPWVFYLQGE
jgi:hydrocephalus-inducing protein